MFCSRVSVTRLLVFSVVCLFLLIIAASPGICQIAQPPEKLEPGHQHSAHHHLHLQMGEEKCAPTFTYEEGPQGPSHWPNLCSSGKMQSPIDIGKTEKLVNMEGVKIVYQPADLDIINDCNQYRILVKIPDNYWLKLGRKPYNLAEIHFRVPGETAVNGKRPRMSIQFLHFSPEGVFLVIEVPVVAGKENAAMKAILDHVPAPGKENLVESVKINPMDLLPADRSSFYRYPGSLTTPICMEVAAWIVMKNPVEFSEAQIAAYEKYYHNNARPLQPRNDRPVYETVK